MKEIHIYQIVDLLSESVTHTFLGASFEHAIRQFEQFLISLKGKIHESDFTLIETDIVEICETFDEALDIIKNPNYRILNGADCVENKTDES